MAGLDPAIWRSELVVKILPFGILSFNEVDFPSQRPMLDILFPLDCGEDLVVRLGIHRVLEPIPLGKSLDDALSMLPGALGEVASDPDIERSVTLIRDDVNPAAHIANLVESRAGCKGRGDGRVKPGHDGLGGGVAGKI